MSDLPKIRYDRLLKLASHLSRGKLIHASFDFATLNDVGMIEEMASEVTVKRGSKTYVIPNCGTAGCAIGECPGVFPEEWHFNAGLCLPRLRKSVETDDIMTSRWKNDVDRFFGLTPSESSHLFVDNMQLVDRFGGKRLDHEATAKAVAANIRTFAKLGRARKLKRRYEY